MEKDLEAQLNETFGALKDYEPETVEDTEDFAPFNGRYECRIDRLERRQGIGKASGEPYDFYGLKLQVITVVSGDKANNRFVDRTFNTDVEGLKKLADTLFTAGIEYDFGSQAGIDKTCALIVDKIVKVRAWAYKGKQYCKVVKDFKVKDKPTGATAPF